MVISLLLYAVFGEFLLQGFALSFNNIVFIVKSGLLLLEVLFFFYLLLHGCLDSITFFGEFPLLCSAVGEEDLTLVLDSCLFDFKFI